MDILVFQHLAVEHPGSLTNLWTSDGHSIHTVELDEGDLIPNTERFGLLAVMGGPMDVWDEQKHPWLIQEKDVIRHWVRDLGRPYLGLCLGHQLLADALGGGVSRMMKPEVGLTHVDLTADGTADRIFAGLGRSMIALQWHGAEISRLPSGSVALASNPACSVQAFRWGKHAYGFQFHLEVTDRTIPDWAAIPEYRQSLETVLGLSADHRLEAEIATRLDDFHAIARRLNGNFFQSIQP